MAELVVEHLVKRFGPVTAVDDVSFTVADGEFVTLLGPSGCGKSTTLAAIAGLDAPDQGLIRAGPTVFFDSRSGRMLAAEERNCGLVFQSYALWPHMTVEQNVVFPLKLRRVPAAEQRRRLDEVLSLVEMTPYLRRYPHELSGGQQQRVALARTLIYEPAVLLLDEPLSNLDAKLRERARTWLSHLQQQVRLTTVYVTHDQAEALALSDRIAVMSGGKIVQLGPPREIYERPVDPFVADFIGTSSFLRGEVVRAHPCGEVLVIKLADGSEITAVAGRRVRDRAGVTVAIRPEKLRVQATPEATRGESGTALPAKVAVRSYLGARWQYQLEVSDIVAKVETEEEFEEGAGVWLWVPTRGCVVFEADGEVGPPAAATAGRALAAAAVS
jgi:iron(III) transport system ATP-binding protein